MEATAVREGKRAELDRISLAREIKLGISCNKGFSQSHGKVWSLDDSSKMSFTEAKGPSTNPRSTSQ